MQENRIYSFIGLARKAGCVAAGDCAAEYAVKRGRASCVILAQDASPNTQKKFRDFCLARKVRLLNFGTKENLGRILGKEAYSVIAITDRRFSDRLEEMIKAADHDDNQDL